MRVIGAVLTSLVIVSVVFVVPPATAQLKPLSSPCEVEYQKSLAQTKCNRTDPACRAALKSVQDKRSACLAAAGAAGPVGQYNQGYAGPGAGSPGMTQKPATTQTPALGRQPGLSGDATTQKMKEANEAALRKSEQQAAEARKLCPQGGVWNGKECAGGPSAQHDTAKKSLQNLKP